MTDPFDLYDDSVAWVADTGLFIACGRQQNNKYTALERFAQRNELTFMIPPRVYDELGGAPDRSTPRQTALLKSIGTDRIGVRDAEGEVSKTDSLI